MKTLKFTCVALAFGGLAACSVEGTRSYSGPDDFIAVAADLGVDSTSNMDDNAGIAVTPDGCQAWLIDDGVDGRASNRLDPVSGLPVCVGEPGVVYGPYQSGEQGIQDRVPGDPLPVRIENVQVRSVRGHFHEVHPAEPHNHGHYGMHQH